MLRDNELSAVLHDEERENITNITIGTAHYYGRLSKLGFLKQILDILTTLDYVILADTHSSE